METTLVGTPNFEAFLRPSASGLLEIIILGRMSVILFSFRKFNIDTTIPNQPKNISPADNNPQTVNSSVTYTWSIAADIGASKSPISYIIEFASDADFNSIIETQNSNSKTLLRTAPETGIYYWRVRAVDGAGNIGTNSAGFKFTVNN